MTPGDDEGPGLTTIANRADVSQVMAQPTTEGRRLRLLTALPDGKLLIGYGDWSNTPDGNTGPIDLLGLDAATGEWSVLYEAMPTEAIETGRMIDGYAWVPSTDPVDAGPGTVLTNSPSGTWQLLTVSAAALHLFDVAGAGTVRYACGSRFTPSAAAVVYKSTDGGDTWTEDLTYAGDHRFYNFRVLSGSLCVVASDNSYHWTLDESGLWVQHSGTPGTFTPPPVTHGGFTYTTNGASVYKTAT